MLKLISRKIEKWSLTSHFESFWSIVCYCSSRKFCKHSRYFCIIEYSKYVHVFENTLGGRNGYIFWKGLNFASIWTTSMSVLPTVSVWRKIILGAMNNVLSKITVSFRRKSCVRKRLGSRRQQLAGGEIVILKWLEKCSQLRLQKKKKNQISIQFYISKANTPI